MMPFWNDSKAENYKTKLEHKMCIAKETPEASFDLADCNLSEVPSGVFSMCRVFLKEVLNLRNNRLSSLPDDICYLTHLQELNLESNRLKKLPVTFGELVNLRTLNLKSNRLLTFPFPVCSLHNLESLNICDNPKVKMLPKDLCNLVLLKCLEFDIERITYPSVEICADGTESIMKFLCSESGKDYFSVDSTVSISETDTDTSGPGDDPSDLSASYRLYQRAKLKKQQDLILMEEALKQNYELQSYTTADANLRRQKLLEDITQEQERMDSEIMLLQGRKEKEKHTLLEMLSKVEDHSAKLINHLMSLNDRTKDLNKMLAVLEKDRIENDEMFTVKHEELEQLRKREILEAMTEQLQSEEKQRKYELKKNDITAKLQNEENESNLKLLTLFQDREIDQQILINKLQEEEEFQKQAFEVLQLKKDLQHKEIAHQIHLIEKELSNLTAAEIKKQDLKVNNDVNILAEHRTALAYLLTDLLYAKEKRELELRERLKQMEMQRVNEMEDFWLIQYQKLLDRKPISITNAVSEIDPDVRHILQDAGASDFLPMFAIKNITMYDLINFSINDLKKIGILDEVLCQKVLDTAWERYKSKQTEKDEFPRLSEIEEASLSPTPSAPPEQEMPLSPEELLNPSAPPLSPDGDVKLWCQTECVICLDSQSSSVFLPCGHVCCCQSCSISVDLCPMCRTTIASKFNLTIS